MNYKVNLFHLFLLISSALLTSCANMVSPSGGLKDVDPPKLLRSKPENNSTNFNSKNIELVFDEYINLKDIQNQFIISPSDINAEIKKDGKKLKISLSDNPKANTTYILNFGDAISDYTENNIAKDFKFILTSGNEIDSLSISGAVVDAYKKEAVKDVIIQLYKDLDNDSIVYKRKPDYTVRTNESGQYRFTNLKKNKYKVFALKEENNNKIFDSQEEQIAFLDTILNLEKNIQISDLKLFTETPQKRKLIAKNISYQKVELIYNKESNLKLIDIHAKIDTVIYTEKKDTLSIYYTENADSTSLYISEEDKIDTIKIKFAKSLKKNELNINVDPKITNNRILISSYDLFELNNSDSILLFEDSIKVDFKLTKNSYNKFYIQYDFKEDKKYNLFIDDSAFVSFQKMYSKKNKQNLFFINPEDYGNLNIKALNNQEIIYELLNDKNEVIRKSDYALNEINYNNLLPGTYRLRMIYDTNHNKKWDTGNYLKSIQPERIEYYLNPIKIRANWDLEIVLIP